MRKSPHAVLLLDEIEKAHPDLFAILLQVMDHATLTDTHGRKADFRHVILIMTTNAGARDLSGRKMGFGDPGQGGGKSTGILERVFAPEFRNRLDATVHFKPLGAEEIAKVVDKHVDELRALVVDRGHHDRADAGGARVAGGERLRPRLRRAADGAAGRAHDQEAAVGAAAVWRSDGRRDRRGRAHAGWREARAAQGRCRRRDGDCARALPRRLQALSLHAQPAQPHHRDAQRADRAHRRGARGGGAALARALDEIGTVVKPRLEIERERLSHATTDSPDNTEGAETRKHGSAETQRRRGGPRRVFWLQKRRAAPRRRED